MTHVPGALAAISSDVGGRSLELTSLDSRAITLACMDLQWTLTRERNGQQSRLPPLFGGKGCPIR